MSPTHMTAKYARNSVNTAGGRYTQVCAEAGKGGPVLQKSMGDSLCYSVDAGEASSLSMQHIVLMGDNTLFHFLPPCLSLNSSRDGLHSAGDRLSTMALTLTNPGHTSLGEFTCEPDRELCGRQINSDNLFVANEMCPYKYRSSTSHVFCSGVRLNLCEDLQPLKNQNCWWVTRREPYGSLTGAY